MKKVLALVLCLSLSMFALVGCSNTETPPEDPMTQEEKPMDENKDNMMDEKEPSTDMTEPTDEKK